MSEVLKTDVFYAVRVGHQKGIFKTWSEVEKHVKGCKGAIYKKFTNLEDAQTFMGTRIGASKVKSQHISTVTKTHNEIVKNKIAAMNIIDKQALDTNIDISLAHPDNWTYHQGSYYIFTDGSFKTDTRKSGWSVYFGDKSVNISQPMPDETTNNKCELLAILTALNQINKYKYAIKHNVTLVTDSEYSLKSITEWMQGWKARGWVTSGGDTVKNLAEFQEIDQIIIKLSDEFNIEKKKQIIFMHQNSHISLDDSTQINIILWEGNTIADYLAKLASTPT